jgi:hypothetical protein
MPSSTTIGRPIVIRKCKLLMPANFDTVRAIACALPEVEEGTSYGTPGLRVKGQFFARLKEDGERLVLKVGDVERDLLMQLQPDIYYITNHYKGYPMVLIHLSKIDADELRDVIEGAWRRTAPKKLVAAYDAEKGRPL